MGGFFGAISKRDVTLDIFFGVDYHSHLGTRRGGMIVYDQKDGFQRQIHNIENTPFRTKFEKDVSKFHGTSGVGCISDTDPQPLLVRSHLGLYAVTTVGIINNADELVDTYLTRQGSQFMAMSSGAVNTTELTAALINQKETLVEGIRYAQEVIDSEVSPIRPARPGRSFRSKRAGRPSTPSIWIASSLPNPIWAAAAAPALAETLPTVRISLTCSVRWRHGDPMSSRQTPQCLMLWEPIGPILPKPGIPMAKDWLFGRPIRHRPPTPCTLATRAGRRRTSSFRSRSSGRWITPKSIRAC